jgi:Arc/MetJ-type ribon-helix-helix transcriptional regulator
MSSNIVVRKPGRPRTGESPGRSIRMPDKDWNMIDEWRRSQKDLPTRSEAVRRLVRLGAKRSK